MNKVRLKDIAEQTGVTVSTVSAALNGTGRIGHAKQKMIRDAANKMGFQPNLAAKLMRSRENNIFGLIISENIKSLAGHGVYSELQENFIIECNTNRIRTFVEINRSMHLPLMLNDGMVRGVIHAGVISGEIEKWLNAHPNFPFVSYEEPWKHCVISEFSSGVFNAMQHLSETGHKRVALICGGYKSNTHSQTLQGYNKGIEEFSLEHFDNMVQLQKTRRGQEHNQENIALLDNLIKSKKRPDALLLSGKQLTSTAIYHLLSNGIRIPEDMSIVAICSGWEAAAIYPGVTAVQRNNPVTISKAIQLLKKISSGIVNEPVEIHVPTGFELRNTVISRLKK